MKRPEKKFALGTLAVCVIWILFEHVMGYNSEKWNIGRYTNDFPVVFYSAMLFVAIYYKRRGLGDTLNFAEGFRTGIIMSLIFSLGFTIVIILYQKFLNPHMIVSVEAFITQQLNEGTMNTQQYESAMKDADNTYGGTFMSYAWLFIFTVLWGIGISAIASLILQKKPETA